MRRTRLRDVARGFLLLLPYLGAAGCKVADPASDVAGSGPAAETVVEDSGLEPARTAPFTAVSFTTIQKGAQSGFRAGDPRFGAAAMVFRDRRSWCRFWSEHDESGTPCPQIPFHREMVVAVHLGSQNSRGPSHPCITVSQVESSPLGWAIRVRGDERPGPLDATSNPFHIVKLPALKGSLRFEHDRPRFADPAIPCDAVPCCPAEEPGSPPFSEVEDPRGSPITVPFTTIEKFDTAFRSDFAFDAADMVFHDQASWCAFWALHDRFVPRRPCPTVDFARDMVIVSCLGWQPRIGPSHPCITINEIRKVGTTWIVSVQDDERGGYLDAIGNPTHIIKVPKLQGPIVFEHSAAIAGDPSPECPY